MDGEVVGNILPQLGRYSRPENDDDITYMKIERPGRTILIVNADRKTAQNMAKRKYGLRNSAPVLTRWTDKEQLRTDASTIWHRTSGISDVELNSTTQLLLTLLFQEESEQETVGGTAQELAVFNAKHPDSWVRENLSSHPPNVIIQQSILRGEVLARPGPSKKKHLTLSPYGRIVAYGMLETLHILTMQEDEEDVEALHTTMQEWSIFSEESIRELGSTDREYLQSVRDDLLCLTGYHDGTFAFGLEGEVKPNENHMFKGKEQCCCNHNCGPTHYVVTSKSNQPDFALSQRDIHFAYATTIIENFLEGYGEYYDFPQAFHAVLPILHDGKSKFSQSTLDAVDSAADFVELLFHHPTSNDEEHQEVVVFYEENAALWLEFANEIQSRFLVPLDNPEWDTVSLYEITGIFDEHNHLRQWPKSPWLNSADLDAYDTHGFLDDLIGSYQQDIEPWYNLITGNDNANPDYAHSNYLQWQPEKGLINYMDSFLAEVESGDSYFGELEIDGSGHVPFIHLQGRSREDWLQDLPQLWIYLMRVFSCYQLARMYCGTFLTKVPNSEEFETLSDQSITVHQPHSTLSSEGARGKRRTSELDLRNRPLSQLVDFIMSNQGENFESVINELRDQMHTGDDRMILYEHIISIFDTEEISGWIASMVPWDAIKRKIELEHGFCDFKHGQQEQAVGALLQILGYPQLVMDKPDTGALGEKWRTMLTNIPQDCTAAGIAVGREIEWYLRVCVKGSIREMALSSSTNEEMKELLGTEHYELSKRNLGNLVNIDLESILAKYHKDENYAKQKLRDDLCSARNVFGHPGEETPHLPEEEAKENLAKLLSAAINFVNWLEKSSISTPIPVVIKSVKSTEHGYYEIEAIKSSGTELIYVPLGTNKEFIVGETWYVIPKSNPMRIEPLMFEF